MKSIRTSLPVRISILICLIILFGLTTHIMLYGYFSAKANMTLPSQLPRLEIDTLQMPIISDGSLELTNPWYIVLIDDLGRVKVETPSGDPVIHFMDYFFDYEGVEGALGFDTVSIERSGNNTVSIIGETKYAEVEILLTDNVTIPRLDIQTRTTYKRDIVVNREALVAMFERHVSEVYKKNAQMNVEDYQPEYWLNRQGVRFGEGRQAALIYHTPGASSLQIDTERKLLFINLEYSLDHPHIHIPLQEDAGGRHIDLSSARYNSGDERENHFSIYFGGFPEIIPRIMLVPEGYEAGYVFTEHADSGDIRTHRAVYFGAEDIMSINDAVGGFAGHRIPVTKSVYYANPNKEENLWRYGGLEVSIRYDPEWPQFLDFLDQLNTTGLYDIGLHTPSPSTSNRELLEESIKFMKDRFDTVTWIDHGMSDGVGNRECYVCDSLDPKSENYAADLWEKYNTRYFWNSAIEILAYSQGAEGSVKKSLKSLRFYDISTILWSRFMTQMSIIQTWGEHVPTPLYWQHPTETGNFYSWATYRHFGHHSGKEWNQLHSEDQLGMLMDNWGVYINHCYPAATVKEYGVWTESGGKIVIDPYFDLFLERMARLDAERKLKVTTIRELLDYWIMGENISFVYMPNGEIIMYNNNEETISGISLAVRADDVRIDGKKPPSKQVGEDIIFWFDFPAKSQVTVTFIQN
ncbi:hypothetical protein ACFLUU_02405 [Chloroflexota bacterium]